MSKLYIANGGKYKDAYSLMKGNFNEAMGKFTRTYYDEDCVEQELYPARRSFEDLLVVCRTYFPRTPKKKLAEILVQLHSEIRLRTLYCRDIEKVVFVRADYESPFHTGAGGFETLDDRRNKKGRGEYSIGDICRLAGKYYGGDIV